MKSILSKLYWKLKWKKDRVMEAFRSNKITFENLQASLDKIHSWRT